MVKFLFFPYLCVLCALCGLSISPSQIESITDSASLSKGEELAKRHCIACHAYTPPELLTKRSWNFLLTYMGMRMGIDDTSFVPHPDEVEKNVLEARRLTLSASNLIPEKPAMSKQDWLLLRQYYADHAPEAPLLPENKPLSSGSVDIFEEKKHRYQVKGSIVSLVHIDEINGQILIGDSRNQQLTILDSDLEWLNHISSKGAFWVDAIPSAKDLYLLSVGDIPGIFSEQKLGKLAYGRRIGNMYYPRGMILTDLYRPTDIELADLDNDGIDELLVCSFGDEGGDFSIFNRKKIGVEFESKPVLTLYKGTGALQCSTHDFNYDGFPDIVLLVGDSDEHLSLFINHGNKSFSEKQIFKTHPSWGYMRFQLVDIDQDGEMDILTTNGDNVDSDPYNTLKRYHGVRVYVNMGDLNFQERYFYPMYGCYHLEAHDYDLDGDIDIAATSFYPDFNAERPENFVYLEQTEPLQFSPKRHPSTQKGRWMTMDAGDLDQDGDIDIALGGAYVPLGLPVGHEADLAEMMETGPTLLFLENKAAD